MKTEINTLLLIILFIIQFFLGYFTALSTNTLIGTQVTPPKAQVQVQTKTNSLPSIEEIKFNKNK